MSHQKRHRPNKGKTVPGKLQQEIVIDVRNERTNFKGISTLLLRKLKKAYQSPMPNDLQPMLATLVDEPFNDEAWQFELKLDGYRAIGYVQSSGADLRSRNNISFKRKFAPVVAALEEWNIDAVIDGELVVVNEDGVPVFNYIQQWEQSAKGHLIYYVFDLLWLEGYNIMDEPLETRRSVLKQILPESGIIRYSDHINDAGADFFHLAKKSHMEGIIAKRKDAAYIPGARSKSWLKIKADQRHEAIICGYTKKKDSDRLFSSLILGCFENGRLTYIGQTGTGFTNALQKELRKKMKPYENAVCPFQTKPVLHAEVIWLKPALVCEVKYTERTTEGVMRHASFQGMRNDKQLADFHTDHPEETTDILEPHEVPKSYNMITKAAVSQTIVSIEGQEIKLTNLNKIYWPELQLTKRDMLRYYHDIAEYMMPYMKDRPQSLNRFPDGIHGQSFYHKDMKGKTEKWMKTFSRFSESAGEPKDFLICTNAAALLYMANLGCIEMNPWHSRVQSPHYPDWCVIDLDPGDIPFKKVIETALVIKDLLDSLRVPSFPKTSGSTGIHVYIPLEAQYNYEQSRQLAEIMAHLVHAELPDTTSLERNPEKRKDKIYIDYLQNRPIQTICAPYSVRPKPGATVSAPLHWTEVKNGLSIAQFTMNNMMDRLKTEGDLFKGVLGKGIDLNKVLKALSHLI